MPANTPRGYSYPLYTDVNNLPAHLQDLAQDIDLDVQNRYNLIAAHLEEKVVRLTKTAIQVLATGANANTTWDTEVTDNDNMANLGVNNARIQLQTAGYYLITGYVQFGPAAAGAASVVVTSSGAVSPNSLAASKALDNDKGTGISWTVLHYAPVVPDNIVVVARQNSGGNINIEGGALAATRIA